MKGKRTVILVQRAGGWCKPAQDSFRSAPEWVAMSSSGDAVTIIGVSRMAGAANKGGNAGTSRPYQARGYYFCGGE